MNMPKKYWILLIGLWIKISINLRRKKIYKQKNFALKKWRSYCKFDIWIIACY
jgi:hypothetical protein